MFMYRLSAVAMAGLFIAMMSGCSTLDFDGKTTIEKVDAKTDKEEVPSWYLKQEDSGYRVFAASTAVSDGMEFAVTKAMHQAKIILAEKVASRMTGTVKQFTGDKAKGSISRSTQVTESATKSEFKDVNISGYTIEEKVIYKVGKVYRAYVLLAIDNDREFVDDTFIDDTNITSADANRASAVLDTIQ